MRSETFSSASQNIATFKKVCDGAHPSPGNPQAMRLFATTPGPSGSAVIHVALARNGVCLARFRAVATATARRTGADGSSGDYICDVIFDESQDSRFDLLGMEGMPGGGSGDSALGGVQWLIGVASFNTITAVTLHWIVTQVI